ncbi:MAG: NADH-quinone oxidoreductase subunit NuoB [Deltaproteobacteria bacterium]|nr:NADH-quinone oxidoreductase subunit NuoB [Deltaproteobacteria bacterium]
MRRAARRAELAAVQRRLLHLRVAFPGVRRRGRVLAAVGGGRARGGRRRLGRGRDFRRSPARRPVVRLEKGGAAVGLVTDHLPGALLPLPGGGALLTAIDQVVNWSRANSLWPLTFGTSCCAIEVMMATGAARHDLARFGAEVARPSPRQADLLIIAGTIVKKMAPRLRTLWEQMAEPRYVIATGSCAISGGPFLYHSYTTIRGADEVIPVDVYVPGCPPRPEALLYGLLTLQKMIREGSTLARPGQVRRPVLAALPDGMTLDDVRAEIAALVQETATVDRKAAAAVGAAFAAQDRV